MTITGYYNGRRVRVEHSTWTGHEELVTVRYLDDGVWRADTGTTVTVLARRVTRVTTGQLA
jgi:hypothetical protein